MLLKLGLANKTYNNIHQEFSFIGNIFFDNEYNCFVTIVLFSTAGCAKELHKIGRKDIYSSAQ